MKNQLQNIISPALTFLKTYISVNYLLSVVREKWLIWAILAISMVLIVVGAVAKFFLARKFKEKVYRKYLNFVFRWSWIFAAVGLILGFFAYEKAVYFGYRLWLYSWLILFIFGLIFSAFKVFPRFRKEITHHRAKIEKEKWFKK